MKTTIDMAREAGFVLGEPWREALVKSFADLVRADERALAFVKLEQRVKEAYQDGHTAGAKSEREACAKLCETLVMGKHCAAAIRARGNT